MGTQIDLQASTGASAAEVEKTSHFDGATRKATARRSDVPAV